jgi:hypothetical protein
LKELISTLELLLFSLLFLERGRVLFFGVTCCNITSPIGLALQSVSLSSRFFYFESMAISAYDFLRRWASMGVDSF